jgi:hypothetical protein
MGLSPEQVKTAARINARVMELIDAGLDDMAIMIRMADLMPDFKQLLDTAQKGDMDALCERFDGFFLYAKHLEGVALASRSGTLKAR